MSLGLETAGQTQIPPLLWEGFKQVFDRMKAVKKTFEDFIAQFFMQAEAEKAYYMNIKSRKYVDLPEGGSLNDNWQKMKTKIETFENMGKGQESKCRSFEAATKQEMDDYVKAARQLEGEYNDIRKKRQNAYDDMKKKSDKYRGAFKEWDDLQTGLDNNTFTGEKRVKMQQVLPVKTTEKEKTEQIYTVAVQAAQQIETEYDLKCRDLLVRFEKMEIDRINSFKKHVKEVFVAWNLMIEQYQKSITDCSEYAQQINVRNDLLAFIQANTTNIPHDSPVAVELCGDKKQPLPPAPAPVGSAGGGGPKALGATPKPNAVQAAQSAPKVASRPGGGAATPTAPAAASTGAVASGGGLFPQEQMVAGGKLFKMLYDYEDSNNNTGTYRVGEVIQVTNMADAEKSGWAMAMKANSQQQGYVPYNYLGPVDGAPAAAAAQSTFEIPSGMQKGKVIYAYTAKSTTETTIEAEEILAYIPDTTSSGWVYVQRQSGATGYVPGNYIGPA